VEKEPKPDKRDATPSNTQDTISVDQVGRVSVEVARKIYRSISTYFGGQTKLDEKGRTQRARKAARARWGKKK
jgi:hypothetical protein